MFIYSINSIFWKC